MASERRDGRRGYCEQGWRRVAVVRRDGEEGLL